MEGWGFRLVRVLFRDCFFGSIWWISVLDFQSEFLEVDITC